MSPLDLLVQVGTIVGGVGISIFIGVAIDYLTSGKVRNKARAWSGIDDLRDDHHKTQMFLLDLGDSHNELVTTVCEEHNISLDNRPSNINTSYYQKLLDDDMELSRGDFVRGE